MASKTGETQKITSKTDDVRMSNIIAAKGTFFFVNFRARLHKTNDYTHTNIQQLLQMRFVLRLVPREWTR